MSTSMQVITPNMQAAKLANGSVTTNPAPFDPQERMALNSLLHCLVEDGRPAELLVWKLNLHKPDRNQQTDTGKAAKEQSRLGRFFEKLWTKDNGKRPGQKPPGFAADLAAAEIVQGCPDLKAYAIRERANSGANNLANPSLLAAIDEEWQNAVTRFSVRFGPRWTVTAKDLNGLKTAADAFTNRYASYSGLILTNGLASVGALLAAVRPYVPVETGLNLHTLREDSPEGRMLAMAYREAPAVIVTDRTSFDALRQAGVSRLHLLVLDGEDVGSEKTREQIDFIRNDVLGQNTENGSGFDSLCQKRMELPYEAASVEDYDSKYHGGTAYQIMDQKLVDIIAENLERLSVKNPRILDLGCGPGSLVNRLRATIPGVQLTGVDLVPEMIQAAKERYPDVEFLVDDAESLSFPDHSFDLVLCSGMLHHLPTLTMAMQEILRVLKPNGLIVAREPNEDNFSARQPQLAYAHLCLRHYLFHALGANPIVEPEAHRYHKSFTFDGFVEEMAKVAYVERLHTDLMVSYFYDEVITDSADSARLAQLDDTLGGQPGLNIVVVARKCETKGIDPAVQKSVANLKQPTPVRLEHYQALAGFAAEVLAQHPIDQRFISSLMQSDRIECLEKLARGGKVLLVGDNPLGLHRLKREYEARSKSWSEKNEGPASQITIYNPAGTVPLPNGVFDCGMIVVDRHMTAADLKKAIDRVSEYGWICLELTSGAMIPAIGAEEERCFGSLPIEASLLNQSGFRLKGVMSKLIHSERDFYKALSVALNIEIPRTPDGDRKALADILFACEDDFEREPAKFSRNQLLNNNKTLLNALNQSLKSAGR